MGQTDNGTIMESNAMVQEGWNGKLLLPNGSLPVMCCHGVLSVPYPIPQFITTTTTTTPRFSYHRVAVSSGQKMMSSVILSTCQAAGMKPVCSGPSGCGFTTSDCFITPM